MERRAFFRAALALASLPVAAGAQPTQSAADHADIARVEAYLNRLKTLKSKFQQIAPDGGITRGTAWIDRPGKLRFEYDPPSPLLLIAGYGVGFFHDKQLGQTTNFPVSSTPLGILLADEVKLSGDITVARVTRLPGQLQTTLYRTRSPGDGSITLVFADNPLALRQWTVVDPQGKETSVTLFDVVLGGRFDSKLFQFADPSLLNVPSGGGGGR
jgi:outer membrane lipoprotein-sorting protein